MFHFSAALSPWVELSSFVARLFQVLLEVFPSQEFSFVQVQYHWQTAKLCESYIDDVDAGQLAAGRCDECFNET
jgi:hypothetical protein